MNPLAQLLETAQELAAGPIASLCGGSQLGDLGSPACVNAVKFGHPEQDQILHGQGTASSGDPVG